MRSDDGSRRLGVNRGTRCFRVFVPGVRHCGAVALHHRPGLVREEALASVLHAVRIEVTEHGTARTVAIRRDSDVVRLHI